MRSVLESLSLLFELTTFAEVGAHAEEFLEYLQSCAKIEEEMTFLAVQQVIEILFSFGRFNPVQVGVSFLSALKISENQNFCDVFTEHKKWNIGQKWVKLVL